MLITLLEVENYKRIKKVVISPGGRSMILIAGKNRQGKSSLIGAMSAALGGMKEAAEQPIRKGQKSADVKIELDDGDLVVHRRFLASGSSRLEVSSPNGKLQSPQKILDRIVGSRFLDPLRFSRLSEKEQREVLLGVVDLGLDLDEHAQQRKEAYQNRANANRDVKKLKIELDDNPDPGEIPEVPSTKDLVAKLEELSEKDAARVSAQHKLEDMRAEAGRKKAEIPAAEKRVESSRQYLEEMMERHKAELEATQRRHAEELQIAENKIDHYAGELKQAQQAYDDFVEEGKALAAETEELAKSDFSEEIEKTRAAIKEASTQNEERIRKIAQKERHDHAKAKLEDAELAASSYNTEIEELDQAKAAALAAANMPVEGLDVDEERVLFREVPLSQASGAEQLEVSLAIAAALSPELKDIWVEDGSLLDQDSLKLVEQFAKDNGLRIWLERVGESDDDAVIIEEGVVKT